MQKNCSKAISIHALREEGDGKMLRLDRRKQISIHALREEGDNRVGGLINADTQFLSTPSVRRATVMILTINLDPVISIHALREEGDAAALPVELPEHNFYPRPP